METNDNDQTMVKCAKCEQQTEDVLILTCDHNLCLQCSADNLRREENKDKYSFHTVVCDLCGAATILDPAAAEELCGEYVSKNYDEVKQEQVYNMVNKHPEPFEGPSMISAHQQ